MDRILTESINDFPIEIKKRYLNRRKEDLEACKQALSEKNWTYLETIGHRLRGNAPSFGFLDLGKIGASLEIAAQLQDKNKVESDLQAFLDWFQRQCERSKNQK